MKEPFFPQILFANCSLVAFGESVGSVARSTAVDDLAKIDAHGYCDVIDMIDVGETKKSVRAFLSVMKRHPVAFPEERVDKDEVDHLANMGKRPVRRPVEEDIADDDLAALAQRGNACKTEAALAQRAQKGHGGPNPGIP